jgi:hypothetical protein
MRGVKWRWTRTSGVEEFIEDLRPCEMSESLSFMTIDIATFKSVPAILFTMTSIFATTTFGDVLEGSIVYHVAILRVSSNTYNLSKS